jgi:hypothetical protein
MLKKTEGREVNNGQSKHTGNIGHKTQNEEKQYVQHNTAQQIKMMINTDPMQKPGVHPHACEG